ncbi:MAG: hypothetical protein U5R31_08125 [Acidimicrobiia bacterium]|nr:hypothetical protein [Acidimicrobiia bacterium]
MNDERPEHENSTWRPSGRLIGAAVIALALLLFVVQNRLHVPIEWAVLSTTAPLWLVIVISAAAGALATLLASSLRHRERRD